MRRAKRRRIFLRVVPGLRDCPRGSRPLDGNEQQDCRKSTAAPASIIGDHVNCSTAAARLTDRLWWTSGVRAIHPIHC
jgi:hypothetical protein